MPAFRLTQLNAQLDELAWKFTRPLEFQLALKDMLEKYADWAYRPGLSVQQGLLIPTYHVQPLVMQKIEQLLFSLNQENPDAGLALADVLWNDEYLEPRKIAISLLGTSSLENSDKVIRRLNEWSKPSEAVQLLDELFARGTERLRREKPEIWLDMIETWAFNSDVLYQEMGLRAMLALAMDQEFENLPPIFRMLGFIMKMPVERLQVPILELIEALADRSLLETIYFLRQLALSEGENRVVLNHVRRCLKIFDEESRKKLRSAVFESDLLEDSLD